MGTEDIEKGWIERAQSGDLEAFERLYRTHCRRVYGVCRRLLDTTQDAEDMTQGVFLSAWRRLGGFRGHSGFGTWLHRIAVNRVIDERKSAWRRYLANPDGLDDVPLPPATPDAAVDLERGITLLAPGARQVLVLHDIEGYTHAEIADLLGVTVGTTKTQLFRARQALKERLR